jgi:hypothetical protein
MVWAAGAHSSAPTFSPAATASSTSWGGTAARPCPGGQRPQPQQRCLYWGEAMTQWRACPPHWPPPQGMRRTHPYCRAPRYFLRGEMYGAALRACLREFVLSPGGSSRSSQPYTPKAHTGQSPPKRSRAGQKSAVVCVLGCAGLLCSGRCSTMWIQLQVC